MVLHKRTEYGFHGYDVPTMPRGCRSARKKRPVRYNAINPTELCAIDLLATVAGKLLLEKDKSTSPRPRPRVPVNAEDVAAIVPQWTDDKPPVKVEPCDQGSCDEGAPLIRCQKLSHNHALKTGPVFPASNARHHTPVLGAPGSPKQGRDFAATPNRVDNPCNNTNSSIGAVPLADRDDNAKKDVDSKPKPRPPSRLASSDSSVEVPATCSSPHWLMPRSRFGNRDSGEDDGEEGSSSACTHPSAASPSTAAFRPQRIGDRRIRKLLSSRFWKVGSSSLKEGEFYDKDMVLRSKKLCYTGQKTHRSCFKRKKPLERSSVSSSSAGIAAAEAISKLSPDYKNNNSSSSKIIKGGEQGNGTSSSITSHRTPSFKSEDYKVKLKIKSFKVPELLIEMPETATVGSLKRAVLETVNAMLGNGLKVGVIYQGRNVRDDSRTLVQAGISCGGDKFDSLNFSLEPNASCPAPQQPITHGCRAEPVPVEQCRSPRPLAARFPALSGARADAGKSTGANPNGRELLHRQAEPRVVVGLASPIRTAGYDNTSSKADAAEASGALVPVSSSSSRALDPPCSELALAVVPASNNTTRRPETTGQRRIRRPFSVAEVEALVQAVEKLGTGRWRDVKLRAFENAKHRTYVDLKDKWKTLVHTARISPQQRRGEPVPQELLDRVLVAHARWSQHQARLQSSKHAANASGSGAEQQQPSCLAAGMLLPPPPQASGSGAEQQQPSCLAAGLLLPPPPQAEQQPQPLAALPPPQALAV